MKPHLRQTLLSVGDLRPLALADPQLGHGIARVYKHATAFAAWCGAHGAEEALEGTVSLVAILATAILRYRSCRGTRDEVIERVDAVYDHCSAEGFTSDVERPSIGPELLQFAHDPDLLAEIPRFAEEIEGINAWLATLEGEHAAAMRDVFQPMMTSVEEAMAAMRAARGPRSAVIAAVAHLRAKYAAVRQPTQTHYGTA